MNNDTGQAHIMLYQPDGRRLPVGFYYPVKVKYDTFISHRRLDRVNSIPYGLNEIVQAIPKRLFQALLSVSG
jgi:hypothetical protein